MVIIIITIQQLPNVQCPKPVCSRQPWVVGWVLGFVCVHPRPPAAATARRWAPTGMEPQNTDLDTGLPSKPAPAGTLPRALPPAELVPRAHIKFTTPFPPASGPSRCQRSRSDTAGRTSGQPAGRARAGSGAAALADCGGWQRAGVRDGRLPGMASATPARVEAELGRVRGMAEAGCHYEAQQRVLSAARRLLKRGDSDGAYELLHRGALIQFHYGQVRRREIEPATEAF